MIKCLCQIEVVIIVSIWDCAYCNRLSLLMSFQYKYASKQKTFREHFFFGFVSDILSWQHQLHDLKSPTVSNLNLHVPQVLILQLPWIENPKLKLCLVEIACSVWCLEIVGSMQQHTSYMYFVRRSFIQVTSLFWQNVQRLGAYARPQSQYADTVDLAHKFCTSYIRGARTRTYAIRASGPIQIRASSSMEPS